MRAYHEAEADDVTRRETAAVNLGAAGGAAWVQLDWFSPWLYIAVCVVIAAIYFLLALSVEAAA